MAPPPVAPTPIVPPMAPAGFAPLGYPTGAYPTLASRSPEPYQQPAAHESSRPVAPPPARDPFPMNRSFGYEPLAPVTAPPLPISPVQPYQDPMIDTGGLAKIMAGLTAPTLDPDTSPPGSRSTWPLTGEPAGDLAYRSDSFGNDPLGLDSFGSGPDDLSGSSSLDVPRQRESRIMPPWQADDLPAEPPGLRLVEPAPLIDPALSDDRMFVDELSGEFRFEPPALRLVESDRDRSSGNGRLREPALGPDRSSDVLPMRGQRAERAVEPAPNDDGDLLIFAAARSAWFTDHVESDTDTPAWGTAGDEGWRAAEQTAQPLIGAETTSGLPRRVPQQNLVPGSPMTSPDRPLHIVRDAAAIAAHTTGYFRGWRRGQEAGGYRVGGRPGREPTAGWDFTREAPREHDYTSERDFEYEYRSARR
jgi:hypothetical protein